MKTSVLKVIIPENGCKVDIEGAIYELCNSNGTANVVYIGYILTSLKRNMKSIYDGVNIKPDIRQIVEVEH